MIQIWEVSGDVITPDDLRMGRVEAGPFHGAQTVAVGAYTVPVKEVSGGCHCALRLSLANAKRILIDKVFSVESNGYWTTFSQDKVVALRFPNGDKFKVIPSVFD